MNVGSSKDIRLRYGAGMEEIWLRHGYGKKGVEGNIGFGITVPAGSYSLTNTCWLTIPFKK